jgi:hypothetical protein
MMIKNKRLIAIVLSVGLILLIPLVAMQFTNEVNWTFFDFVAAAVLLLGTGLTIELAIRTIKNKNYQIALIVAILFLLFLVWAELAVGIFGSPIAGS